MDPDEAGLERERQHEQGRQAEALLAAPRDDERDERESPLQEEPGVRDARPVARVGGEHADDARDEREVRSATAEERAH